MKKVTSTFEVDIFDKANGSYILKLEIGDKQDPKENN